MGPYIHSGLVRIAEELYALNVASKQQTSSTMCMYLTIWILFINLYTIFTYAQMQNMLFKLLPPQDKYCKVLATLFHVLQRYYNLLVNAWTRKYHKQHSKGQGGRMAGEIH